MIKKIDKKYCYYLFLMFFLNSGLVKAQSTFDFLKPSVFYSISDNKKFISPEKNLLLHRLKTKKAKVDPITLYCKKSTGSCDGLIQSLSKPQKEKNLRSKIHFKREKKIESLYKFKLTEEMLPFFSLSKLQHILGTYHHNLVMKTEDLYKSKDKRFEFFSELKNFLTKKELKKIKKKIRNKEDLVVGKDLLPARVESKVGKYTSFLGPNCFEAALSFQDESFSKSYRYNARSETGHHKIMINNDELYEALKKNFYPVDYKRAKLRYGDLLVFVDMSEAHSEKDMKFSWIKHAFVFLFNDFTFSKGSKSSNSPYTIKTLAEEWSAWKRQYPELGIQVYRKPVRKNSAFNTKKLLDWIY